MKRIFITFILSISYLFPKAQSIGDLGAYYPNGSKITFKYTRIADIIDSIGFQETYTHSYNKNTLVYFKKLTNKPLFIFFSGKEMPLTIKSAIASFNYTKYLNNYSYYYDLQEMLKTKTLTKKYLLAIFNSPEMKGQNDDKTEFWIFLNYNLKINFKNDNILSFDVMNFKEIYKNELSISSFTVTGSDYSIGFNISLSNFAAKTIKYCYITVTATNPVDDKVGTETVTAVGPIKENGIGSYEFDNIIYSNVAKYLSIENIKIQFMDGTFKTISKKQIADIQIIDWNEYGNRTIEELISSPKIVTL